jgi:hypothetical protein
MPELSRFYGIVVRLYYDDHAPPHFHAYYGEDSAVIDIRRLAAISGTLPPRALALVLEWGALHQAELLAAWERAVHSQPPGKIAPLA